MWLGDRSADRLALRRASGFVLPGFVAFASLGILVGASWYYFGPIAVGLAAVTLVLTGVRLAFRPALYLARERLRSSEDRYRLLFERNPQPVVAYDRQTLQIVAVSDAVLASYGYSHEECMSMTIEDLVPSADVPALRAHLARPAQGGPDSAPAFAGFSGRHQHKDGAIIDMEVTSESLDLDGRDCAIAFCHDITERNRAAAEVASARDQAVEASNMKSAFLANMSHEIRTPMNGVLGMNELLLGMGLTDEQRECAEQVARSGGHMLMLINDILDISKIETGHLELDLVDFDLDEMIKQTCSAAARLRGRRVSGSTCRSPRRFRDASTETAGGWVRFS